MTLDDVLPPIDGSADARLEFVISQDRMAVSIKHCYPPVGNGRTPCPQLAVEQLGEAGIVADIFMEELEQACALLLTGDSAEHLIVAQGRPPIELKDAAIIFFGNPDFPVLPGMRIGRLSPAVAAVPGMAVDGQEILPQNNHVPATISLGDNITLDRNKRVLSSQVYGLIRFEEGRICVEPLIRISEDHFQVSSTFYRVDYSGSPLTPPMFSEELKRLGVVIKPELPALQSALARAAAVNATQDAIIAIGVAPTPGKDGWLELSVKVREAGPIEVEGRIDYCERGVFPFVEEDEIVAVLHPPTKGVPGMDVFGKPHPARDGRSARALMGKNVALLPDGIGLKAKIAGMLLFEKQTLAVTECLEVKRDVNFVTGNIRAEKGSVKIHGAVSKGFRVDAPGHVIVWDVVESALVEAGEDVHVRGGLIMPAGGMVKAGGQVVAQYATNARIEARGDVIIANEACNSKIRAGGRFIATKGSGIVQGSEIVCGAGACINELGSPFGTHTMVTVSAKDTVHTALLKEKSKLRRRVRRVDEIIGISDPKTILTRTPVSKRQAVAEIIKARIRDKARLEEIGEILAQEQEQRLKALEAAKVIVHGTVHSGVVIKFGGYVLNVLESIANATFSFDRCGRGISVSSR